MQTRHQVIRQTDDIKIFILDTKHSHSHQLKAYCYLLLPRTHITNNEENNAVLIRRHIDSIDYVVAYHHEDSTSCPRPDVQFAQLKTKLLNNHNFIRLI